MSFGMRLRFNLQPNHITTHFPTITPFKIFDINSSLLLIPTLAYCLQVLHGNLSKLKAITILPHINPKRVNFFLFTLIHFMVFLTFETPPLFSIFFKILHNVKTITNLFKNLYKDTSHLKETPLVFGFITLVCKKVSLISSLLDKSMIVMFGFPMLIMSTNKWKQLKDKVKECYVKKDAKVELKKQGKKFPKNAKILHE